MIKKIEIQNFQSHKKTELEFHPGVNVIIGPSDSGKTAVLRALLWLINNRPLGESFRSLWGGDTEVNVVLDQGMEDATIERIKTNKENYYFQSVDDEKYKALGKEVPERITELLNLNQINIQSQLDPPFLLHSKSAGEVARYLNKIVNLEVIDSSIANINKKLRVIQSEIQTQQKELVQTEEELDKLSWTKQADKELLEIEQQEKEFNQLILYQGELTSLIAATESAEKDLLQYQGLDELDEQCQLLKKEIDEFEITKQKHQQLESLANEIEKLMQREKSLANKTIKQQEEFNQLMPDSCPLCGSAI